MQQKRRRRGIVFQGIALSIMDLNTLEKLLRDSVTGIKLCSEAGLVNSALVLLYSGIDTASSLDLAYDKQSVRLRYTQWCDAHMFKGTSFDFTSLELYATRCGVIHESSVESDLSREGKARRIIYAESDIEVDTLREMNRLARITDYVAVKFEDLIKAYESGLVEFIKSLRGNEERSRFALNKANMCLREHPKGEMESLLEWGKSLLRNR